MSVIITNVSAESLSEAIESQSYDFINNDRHVNDFNTLTSINSLDLIYPDFSNKIKNINFNKNYECFVTDTANINSFFSTISSIESIEYGMDFAQNSFQYDTIINDFSPSVSSTNDTQFLGIINDRSVNLIPLKNKYSIDNNIYSNDNNYRNYQKIYNEGDMYVQFKTNKLPKVLESDKYSIIYNSYNIASSYINDTTFIEDGAIGGSCPLNSDLIFFDTSEYNTYSYNGLHNGTLLCAWLSSQTHETSSAKIWMERWYDSNTVTQGDAFITSVNNLSSIQNIIDIPSTKIINDTEQIIYLRYGPLRNETYINSLSASLVAEFDNWSNNFTSNVNEFSGVIPDPYNGSSDVLELDGSLHAHIPPSEDLLVKNNMSLSLWAYSNDWTKGTDAQFFGNSYNGTGYSLNYTSGEVDNLISIVTKSGILYSLNTRGYKVLEKNLMTSLDLSAMSIDYIKTDIFSNRWMYDSYNHNIYKLESDDLITVSLPLNSNATITKMDCDSNNNLYILDSFTNNISSFNSDGEYLSNIVLTSSQNNFVIHYDDTVEINTSEYVLVDNFDNTVKIMGATVFVNEDRILHLTDRPHTIKIDRNNYIWILYKNRLLKTDIYGEVHLDVELDVDFISYDSEMDFVSSLKNNEEVYQLWIIFNKQKMLLVLDENAKILKRIDMNNIFSNITCLDTPTNMHGDFTGADNKRRFNRLNDKIISKNNPALSFNVGLKCGTVKKYISLSTGITELRHWVHFASTVENIRNYTIVKLFKNGKLVDSKTLEGNYQINYGIGSPPFIVGGFSGKIAARKLEKAVFHSQFFIGKIDDIKIYNTVLDEFEILNLSINNHYGKWNNMSYYITIPETTFIEEIDTFHINRYKGFKSNIFNIVIKNFTDNIELQNLMKTYIVSKINSLKPANTILNQIRFE